MKIFLTVSQIKEHLENSKKLESSGNEIDEAISYGIKLVLKEMLYNKKREQEQKHSFSNN